MAKKERKQVYQLTPEKNVKSLMSLATRTSKKTAELNGELGQAIANATEHHHLHRKAFAVAKAEMKMEADKLAEYYASLNHYRDVLGLNEKAESAPRLDMGETETDDGKVVPIKEAAE